VQNPRHRVPSNWGLCFAGNESAFCSALDEALSTANGIFRYVEIGIGYGDCLRAVDQYLNQCGKTFAIYGVDISECHPSAIANQSSNVAIHLNGSIAFLRQFPEKADFIFIDGCHGAPCVTADFLAAEGVVRSGSVICFHDTDPGCQDIHPQPHCRTGIRAREAVEKLGLLNDTRKGWFKIGETSGDKGKGGHGCLFVKRV